LHGFRAVASEPIPLEWSSDGRFVRELTVRATKFVEVCGKLPAQAKVQWAFEAGARLNFNVHYHQGKEVHYPAKRDRVVRASGTLDAKLEQDYCWMWINKSPRDATLRMELKRS
jgi:sugar phosphate isomerase/epimerase